jgi:hypothetical protein
MVSQLIHHFPIEATGRGEGIKQQRLIEPPHHDDPIESLAVRREADRAVSPSVEAPNLLIKRRRGPPVEDHLGLAGAPPEIRGRKVEIGVRYRALQLADTLACNKNQRSMRFDDLDTIYSRTMGGRIPQEGDYVSLIVAQERVYSV